MKRLFIILALSIFARINHAQTIYFPPISGTSWEKLSFNSVGWDSTKTDTLFSFLKFKNTKAFLVLKNGKIVIEKYFDTFTQDSLWYWASAGKSLTSFLIGLAQQEGYLSIDDSTSKYLGRWTSEPADKEAMIKIKNQLTMTSGLKDNVPDHYCTLPECLIYLADAGTRWAYHNGPYTLLDSVIQKATGQNLTQYFINRIRTKTGMTGLFLKSGYNNVFYSTPRSMARYGLLILNKGRWDTTVVMSDTAYFNKMVNTSQNINKSYGYLWWLNGKESYMLPQTQFVFPGYLCPDAPKDMIAALGKNGQQLNVVPSQSLIFVRMGNAPDSSFVPTVLNNDIWKLLNPVISPASNLGEETKNSKLNFRLEQNYPNPFNPSTQINYQISKSGHVTLKVFDILGREVATLVNEYKPAGKYMVEFNAGILSSGIYFYKMNESNPTVISEKGYINTTKKMVLIK